MATLVVSIICIVLIVTGGVMLTQGILSSADTTAVNVVDICKREGEFSRTDITALRAEYLDWSDLLRITVENTGQVKLGSFDDWDVFITYRDAEELLRNTWLPRVEALPGNNEWQLSGIGFEGPIDFFEPGIINPGEQAVLLANPDPDPGTNTAGRIAITSPNGVSDTVAFLDHGCALLVPHAENMTLASTKYYQCVAAAADSEGMVVNNIFFKNDVARKILCNEESTSREGRFFFSLAGIPEIPAGNWIFSYRCMVDGEGVFPRSTGDVRFNVDINVYSANGTLRGSIATEAAPVDFPKESQGTWVTLSGSYQFPGYFVEESTDYLEIAYYGVVVNQGPSGDSGYLNLLIDDHSLPFSDQTRIEA